MFMIGESLVRVGCFLRNLYLEEEALEKARKERLEKKKQELEEKSTHDYHSIIRK